MIEKQFDLFIKSIQVDDSGEFKPLIYVLQSCGVSYWLTYPHTYEQNSVVKTRHRHIVKKDLALLL